MVDFSPTSLWDRARGAWSTARASVTPLGWFLAGAVLLLWFVAVVLDWREANVIALMLILLLLVAIAFTLGRVNLETVIRVAPSRVVVGDRAAGELTVRNMHTRAARGLRLELPVGKALGVYSLPILKPGDATDELFVVPTNKRAIIPVGPVATVKGDPLGILRRVQTWSDVQEIFVHPKTVPLSTVAAGLIRDMEGQATKQLSPSDVAFHTLREYVRGDDLRHVHWKSSAKRSAKLDKLLVRQYVDTRRSDVAVLLSTDLAEYASEDEFELSVSCAASVAIQALRDDQTLTVLAGAERLLGNGPKPILDRFSGVEGADGAGGLEIGLRSARRLAPNASVIVICVGSNLTFQDTTRAIKRTGTFTRTVVLRSALGSEPAFNKVGSNTLFNIPELARLGRSMEALNA